MIGRQVILINKPLTLRELEQIMQDNWDKEQYGNFKIGNVRHPNDSNRLGETAKARNGQKMTIIAYRSATDIDVQFEDGEIATKKTYQMFILGEIRHPKLYGDLVNTRVGETSTTTSGIKMFIIAYRRYSDIDVQFEDGTVRKGISYGSFKKGEVSHPCFPMFGNGTYKTFQTQYAYTAPDGKVYFYCECQQCGFKANLTVNEIIKLDHDCWKSKDSVKVM